MSGHSVSWRFGVTDSPASNPAFSSGRQIVSFCSENHLAVPVITDIWSTHGGFVLYIMYDMAQRRYGVYAIVEIPRLLIPVLAFLHLNTSTCMIWMTGVFCLWWPIKVWFVGIWAIHWIRKWMLYNIAFVPAIQRHDYITGNIAVTLVRREFSVQLDTKQ